MLIASWKGEKLRGGGGGGGGGDFFEEKLVRVGCSGNKQLFRPKGEFKWELKRFQL